jgi:EmrB/QacA subfamily drug resistance transporter
MVRAAGGAPHEHGSRHHDEQRHRQGDGFVATDSPHDQVVTAPAQDRTALALACGATFLTFLDTTVVNVAFPALRASMPTEPFSHLSWVVTSYAILFAALLSIAGRYADLLGHRRVYATAIALFTAASAACAAAPNLTVLVVARAVQGVGAAALVPSALGLLLVRTPKQLRAAAIGYLGSAGAVAAVVGPAVGGGLTIWLGWRMVFAINVPLGVALTYGAVRRLREVATPRSTALPDVLGAVLLTLGIGMLGLGVSQSGDWGATSGSVLTLLLGGLVLLGLGVARAARHRAPAIELSLLRVPRLVAANLSIACFSAAMYVVLLSSPLFLTAMWHYTLFQAALSVTPGAFASIVMSTYLGKRASARAKLRAAAVGAAILVVTAVLMFGTLNDHHSFWLWLPFSLGGGAAAGLVFTSLSVTTAASVAPTQFAASSGLLTTARQLGGSLGIAVMAAMLGGSRASHPELIRDVWLFCVLAALVAIGPALLLTRRQASLLPSPTPAQATETTG